MSVERILSDEEAMTLTGAVIQIPEGYTKVGKYSDEQYTQMEHLIFPMSITDINLKSLIHCRRLSRITVHEENISYADVDGVLFSKDMTELIFVPPYTPITQYSVPSGVKRIGDWAFAMRGRIQGYDANFAYKLSSISLPEGLEYIGGCAFDCCRSLTEINIPNSVTHIGVCAFYLCGIESVIIPDSVLTIGEEAFSCCEDLRSVKMSAGITQFPENAFLMCSKLEEIEIGQNVEVILDNALSGCSELPKITTRPKVFWRENNSS